ncbi:uncharacterized protein LOC129280415 [Lytechinus pictus]|uniref:uncharacterized protein LOC129280415 n=1 Tax=Lytechinus pictus TaxID=7653 RepID=UPI0030BA1957
MALTADESHVYTTYHIATHICREIGYSESSVYYTDGSFGLADTVFANNMMQIPGNSRYVFLKNSAKKGAALGVACKETENPITVDISIYEESKALALLIGQDVRLVCLDGYLHLDELAHLACKNLGYQRAVIIQCGEVWPEWNRFFTFHDCNGKKLNDCKFYATKTMCDHVLELHCDIGVSVSLNGGEGDYDGQIELSLGNGLNLTGGVRINPGESFYHTVCKSLGYEKAVYMTDNAPLGTLSNKFFSVLCPVDAANLSFCLINNAWPDVSSGENLTMGVICNAADALPVRLIEGDGIGTSTGIVEVRMFNEWTTLRLRYMYILSNFVGVLCLQLDFSPYNTSVEYTFIDDGGGRNLPAYQVQCETNALDLRSCLFKNSEKDDKRYVVNLHLSCDPEPFNHCNLKDALYPCDARNGGCSSTGTKDVICWCKDGYALDTDGRTCIGQALNIRLASGSAPFSGNIEIKYLGNWTLLTFCPIHHSYIHHTSQYSPIPLAEVTCSSLGYSEVQSYMYTCNSVEALTDTPNSTFNNPVCSTKDINSCYFLSHAYCSATTRWLPFVTCNEESFNPCLQKGLLYPCDPNIGGCTMLVNRTYQCTCPSGMILDTNNKTCIVPRESPLQIIGFLPPDLKESFESLRKSLFDDDSLSNDTSSDDSDSYVSVARRLDSFLDDMLETNITDLLHIVQDDIELIALPLDTKLDVQSITFGLDNESRSSLLEISIPIASLLEGHNGSLIAGAFAVIKLKRNGTERIHHNVSDSSRSGYLNSDVVSIKLSGVNTTYLKQNISISFPTAKTSGSGYSPHCSFLEENEGSGSTWSLRGCSRKNVAEGAYYDVITCTCNHLTSFAILMLTNIDVHATVASSKHSFILSIATYAGLTFSIISLVLSLIAFFISKIQTTRLFLMKNQCIAMILAQGLFAAGVVQAKRITVLCGIVAGATHLLFLAVFAWMLNQGIYIMLQLGIRRLTNVQVKRWQYSVIGWGIPSAIVGITSAVDYRLYLDGSYCWLATVRGGAYAFIGPVLGILMVNLGIFFYTISRFTSVKAFKNKSEKGKIRSTLRAVSVLCPILGITWALGLFVRVHISLEYSFTILNSSQGVLLFIFQVLLNEEVYVGVRRRMRRHIIYPVGTTEASQTENKSVAIPTISTTRQETKSSSDESGNMDMEVVSLKD